MNLRRSLYASCILLLAMGGCLEPPAPGRPTSELVLDVDGQEVRMPLDMMNVYLSENKNFHETFDLNSPVDYDSEDENEPPYVQLSGKFPLDLRIGSSEHWELLFGKPIEISRYGGDRRLPHPSTLKLPDQPRRQVVGGTVTFEDIYYARIRSNTSPTISGKIRIRVRLDQGETEYSGTFAIRCMGWAG